MVARCTYLVSGAHLAPRPAPVRFVVSPITSHGRPRCVVVEVHTSTLAGVVAALRKALGTGRGGRLPLYRVVSGDVDGLRPGASVYDIATAARGIRVLGRTGWRRSVALVGLRAVGGAL